jgi:hypothetical protein
MKGTNVLVANAATVMEAMQEYLDRRTVGSKADKVESVSAVATSGSFEYRFYISERKQESKEEGKK